MNDADHVQKHSFDDCILNLLNNIIFETWIW